MITDRRFRIQHLIAIAKVTERDELREELLDEALSLMMLEPISISDGFDDFLSSNNNVGRFKRSELYESYCNFIYGLQYKPLSKRAFYWQMRQRGPLFGFREIRSGGVDYFTNE